MTRLLAAVLAVLSRLADAGLALLPDHPHRYAEEAVWPGSCWCGKPKGHLVHAERLQ